MADEAAIFAPMMQKTDPYAAVNDINRMQQGLITTQQMQTSADSAKLELAGKQLNNMSSMISDLLNDPAAGRSDMSKKISERVAYGVKQGIFTPAQAVEGLKQVPNDPRQQFQWMTTHLGQIMTAKEKLDAYLGPQTTEPVGAGSVTTQTPNFPAPPGQPPKEPLVRKIQSYGLPPNTPEVVPSGPNRGATSPLGQPGIAMPTAPGAPPAAPPLRARPPAPVQRPAAPPASAAAPGTPPAPGTPTFAQRINGTGAPPDGRIVTSLPPGTPEAMQGAAIAYNHASEGAAAYPYRVNPLRQAIPILEKMKLTDTGPVSDRINEIRSAAQSLGAGPLLGIDPEKIKDFNELKKYFSQYSAQAGAALGPKTNEGLATAVTSNPNVHMDKLSATELAKVALGVERMRQAGILEFSEQKNAGKLQPADFNEFMLKWGTQQDPRAFVYDLMDKKGRDAVRKLPPAEQRKIHDAMTIADKHGLLGDVHRGE